MNTNARRILCLLIPLLFLLLYPEGCKKSSDVTGPSLSDTATSINNIIPSGTITRVPGSTNRIQINLLGIIDPTSGQPIVLTTANTAVFEDGVQKDITITVVGGSVTLKADVVFTVDNSGSMSEEADSIASKIVAFANYLQQSGLDAKFGCVGYAYGVNGAQNLTDPNTLSTFLNRSTGTYRTEGYSGSDATRLENASSSFYNSEEDGIIAILFADSLFSWRSGANRVFVNFTDESLQPDGINQWSVNYFRNHWNATKGTVHTVFSISDYYWSGGVPDTTQDNENYYTWTPGTYERPWTLSNITGGSVKFIHSSATDLNLAAADFPVTGALASSYRIEYTTSDPNATHTVIIVVRTATADGKVTYYNIRYN